ncbi:MAG TPA: lytic transglycosylase domain-containing protein [Spirochaetota bacterium]|nr:lytic transglycosylase domain-containing protein [Spirochaetota bacterium]HOS32456.1 lytic transglycosylase domain-containing protein [Spirochaetota bacterium]HOS55881.1 lytic transglycosylase domain-containing protein [Spirochaetota bacterium]HQF77463.1 lytic transglycosylase domain-containing protein [Spirochaetota bacterium]HQH30854.1 lytic transglycosylase domain-containing protein [Spirochaetota bacterium]
MEGIDGLNNIYKRMNEIRNTGKNLRNIYKPDKVKEFENMYKDAFNSSKSAEKKEKTVSSSSNLSTELEADASLSLKEINLKDDKSKINDAIAKSSAKYKVAEDLIRAVITVESGYNRTSVSKAGAMGLMQLMPKTSLELGVEKPFDIYENVDGGVKYLRMMLDKYDNNLEKALAAYNAGPNSVDKNGGVPDIKETKNYIRLIKKKLLE